MKKTFLLLALGCCMALRAENPARPDADGFITDWLVGGPYPSYLVQGKETGFSLDYLKPESAARPAAGETQEAVFKVDPFKVIDDTSYVNEWGLRRDKTVRAVWKKTHFKNREYMSVDGWYGVIDDHFIFYNVCYIESPAEREVEVRVGSDDDNKVYLNGKYLGGSASAQAVKVDQFRFRGKLRQGVNVLLVKVVDRLAGAGFCCRITTPEGKPVTDLKVHLDDPYRLYQVNSFANGFGAKYSFPSSVLFDDMGEIKGKFKFHAPDKRAYSVRLGQETFTLRSGEERSFPFRAKTGEHRLRAVVLDPVSRKECAVLNFDCRVHSRAAVKKELAETRVKLQQIQNVALPQWRAKKERAKKDVVAAEQMLKDAQKTAEKNFSDMRKKAQQDALPSIAEPFRTVPDFRASLLLNGIWKMGLDPNKMDQTFRLPSVIPGSYWAFWHFPVRRNKNGQLIQEKGYEDVKINPMYFANNRYSAEKEFHLDKLPAGQLVFCCGYAAGELKVYCNNQFCGQWNGVCGLVEIPLKNLKIGKNTLRIDWKRYRHVYQHTTQFGLLGDLTLEERPAVYVNDVWVRPSWRKAELATVTELRSTDGKPHVYRMEQYAVKDGKIRFRLPSRSGTLPPGKLVTVQNRAKWRDPELWDIEHPNLYQMVSDLYVDGKLADRKFDEFGFREFWCHGCDFYINGRRIILQGDTGCDEFHLIKRCDVYMPLLRRHGINLIRLDDYYPETVRYTDRRGMLLHKNTWPIGKYYGRDLAIVKAFRTPQDYLKTEEHLDSLKAYESWVRLYRNHPSVIIWSVSNELNTPGCWSRGIEKRNEYMDAIMDVYQDYVEQLNPEAVTTRDGDVCTYNSTYPGFKVHRFGNVHYPEYQMDLFVENWQEFFEYRPVLWGETFYCSTGSNNWQGPKPDVIAGKAAALRNGIKAYRRVGIPGSVYMGISLDGFFEFRPDGSGNPWGVTETTRGENRSANYLNRCPVGQYPYTRVQWPADSGSGQHPEFHAHRAWGYGYQAINWSNEAFKSHVANAVSEAYRQSLIPQPALAPDPTAEVVVKASPDADVWTVLPDGRKVGVRADAQGRAWFELPKAGVYTFRCGRKSKTADLKDKTSYSEIPGFRHVPQISMED